MHDKTKLNLTQLHKLRTNLGLGPAVYQKIKTKSKLHEPVISKAKVLVEFKFMSTKCSIQTASII